MKNTVKETMVVDKRIKPYMGWRAVLDIKRYKRKYMVVKLR
jgi:hypothetical protein